jgi:serine phosphatase RsbU (regulator of sigma subunit)/integral membrane sensor domain MASE1
MSAAGGGGGADLRIDPADNPLRHGATAAFWGDSAGLFAVVFLAFATGAVLSWESFGSALGPSFFYPSAGVTVAAMILTRRALWPAVLAAVVAGEVIVDSVYGSPTWVALGFAAANMVEPVIGASLTLAWCRGRPDLRMRRDLVAFLVAACTIAPLFGGLVGGTVSAVADPKPVLGAVLDWWAGDAVGVLVVAPPILLWATQSYVVRQRPWETVGLLVGTAVLSVTAFWTAVPPSMLILPMLAWAALRLDMLGAALAGAVAALLANVMTTRGHGLFISMPVSVETQVALTQVFIVIIVVVAMLIAQEASGRMTAVQEREAERRERIRLETLSRLAQELAAALTPRDIGDALEAEVLNEAGARALNLGLVSADGRNLDWVTMSGHPQAVVDEFSGGVALSERTVGTDTVRFGQPVLVRTSEDYGQRYPEKAYWARMSGAESTVGWPLTAGGKPFGVLLLVWSQPQPFNEAQRAYVSAVATMVGQALVRAQVYSDEHARAAVLQAAVLPTSPVDTCGLDVAVTYEPADVTQGLGGDWYDIMTLPTKRIYFAVGDVVGHGLPAVEDMAQLRSAGRALAHQGLPPAQLLAELNGFTRHASRGKFATMAVVILDPDEGTLSYGLAGHPPPFLRLAADGEVIRLDEAHGPVLGPVEDATYGQARIRIAPGDVLVMYTDGLVERHGMDIETGLARAQQMIAGWDRHTKLAEYCEALQETLAPRPRADDVCIIAVRFDEAEAGGSPG